jgi:putative FmdB family regulatory protein
MPLYEYRCGKCGRQVEELVAASDAEKPVKCPDCGRRMERLLSAPGGIRMGAGASGSGTCCGRTERCDSPPCSGGSCGCGG